MAAALMKKMRRARGLGDKAKAKECEMLKRKKQSMLAKQAADQKLVDVFMLFIEAIGRRDAENAQKLAEKAMMCAILNMMHKGSLKTNGIELEALKLGINKHFQVSS
ncbi:hypothetical protein V6N11_074014 [Hibiscus sabdariffa]|uniref:Uncharacterized protein n=2 Tax=Hibiscus sabdariffa TaxID=183260 RepID=A0ABR2P5P5_9ROSI